MELCFLWYKVFRGEKAKPFQISSSAKQSSRKGDHNMVQDCMYTQTRDSQDSGFKTRISRLGDQEGSAKLGGRAESTGKVGREGLNGIQPSG